MPKSVVELIAHTFFRITAFVDWICKPGYFSSLSPRIPLESVDQDTLVEKSHHGHDTISQQFIHDIDIILQPPFINRVVLATEGDDFVTAIQYKALMKRDTPSNDLFSFASSKTMLRYLHYRYRQQLEASYIV